MNEKEKIARIIAEFESQLALARATDLARCGKHMEAESILCNGSVYPSEPAHLDLLARIYVLQKAFSEAKKAWQLASKYAPENKKYLELIKKLEMYEQQCLKHKIAVLIISAIVILIITVIVWFKVVAPLK